MLRVFYPSQAEARKEEVDAEIESVNAQLEKLMKEKSLLEKELRTNNGRLRQFPVHIHNSVFTFLYVCNL